MFASSSGEGPPQRPLAPQACDVLPSKHICDQGVALSPISKASNASSSGNLVLLGWGQRSASVAPDQVRRPVTIWF